MPATTIRVRFATNRNRTAGADLFGPDFRDGNPAHYVTGTIDVAKISNLPDSGWAPLRKTLHIDPPSPPLNKVVATQDAHTTPATGMLEFAAARKQAEAVAPDTAGYGLVLLPGFASTFLDAMRRAAQIANGYHAADVFCFSWPANGKVDLENYLLDREDASKSGAAIADALAHLFATIGAMPAADRPKIHLVAHSMGNFALRAAVQAIRRADPDLIAHRVFEGALLMAADEDLDSLSQATKLGPLNQLARHIAVYHAGGDMALTVSEQLNGPRLGLWGPQDMANLARSITSIDCSDVSATQGDHGETHFSHQYYRLSSRVIGDVVQVLHGTSPDEIIGRLADPTGGADGRAFWLPFDANAGFQTLTA